jgi:hypothetical protein
VSEELESGLKEAIQNYLSDRVRGIDDQLARLQQEYFEAFSRLRESAAALPTDAPLSSAISAQLQAARDQRPAAAPSPDFSVINKAIEETQNQQTQSEILAALLKNAANFADRVALFVVKGNQAIGWRVCEGRDRSKLEPMSGVALALNGNTVVSHAARSGSAATASGTSADDGGLIEKLGGEPQQLAALPLIVRKRAVAVLYADSAWPHRDAIQLDALETLTRVAGMAVELIAPARSAQTQTSVAAPAAAPEPETISAPAEEPQAVSEETQETRFTYTPEVVAAEPPESAWMETPVAVSAEPPPAEPMYTPEVAPPPAESMYTPEVAPPPAEPMYTPEVAPPPAEPMYTPEVAPPPAEVAPPEPEPPAVSEPFMPAPERVSAETPTPAYSPQYSTPLGTSRRYGVVEPELPIDVGEDERRLHNDARRFARLLVSEIKLYNEQKVSEGRSQGNLYDRLREDIDRSRQMYDKRVAPPVAARHDYFHQELVNTLAEGDPAKLGNSYPGAAVGVA